MSKEVIRITRGEMIDHLSQSMFDDLEMNPDYLILIIAEGFMGYNNYTTKDLIYEYREYVCSDNPDSIVIELENEDV
jgi:hypothetical protein